MKTNLEKHSWGKAHGFPITATEEATDETPVSTDERMSEHRRRGRHSLDRGLFLREQVEKDESSAPLRSDGSDRRPVDPKA